MNNDTLTARSVKSHFFNEMNLSRNYFYQYYLIYLIYFYN